jgi:4-diphosphocytidyl-2-C-methyl-D-erythritol kinase
LTVELTENAPAKVNLTLRVLGRRADGYHEIESLVVFASECDRLMLIPDDDFALKVSGPRAAQAGDDAENLVLKAARALAARMPGIRTGAFHLEKNLPVAAGLGGGSSDAAAALRLLARTNGCVADDPRLYDAARVTGADVPVCLDPRARLMRGIGEKLSGPLSLLPLHAVLVNPGVALATKLVFAQWRPVADAPAPLDLGALTKSAGYRELMRCLLQQPNDLEAPAIALKPVIGDVLAVLCALDGCELARMSGSGATCFGLFASGDAAKAAAKMVRAGNPDWWIVETELS